MKKLSEKLQGVISLSNGDGKVEVEAEKKEDREELSLDSDDVIPTLKKGKVESVLSKDTYGMKAIRHALKGLQSSEKIMEELAPIIQEKDTGRDDYIDFLHIYDQLTPEERPAFEKAMDALNHKRQQEIESRGYEGAREKWRKDFERQRAARAAKNDTTKFRKLDTLLWEWNEAMIPLIQDEYQRVREVLQYSQPTKVPTHLRGEGPVNVTVSDRFEYGPYLLLVKPDNLPAITMLELLNLNSTGGINEGMRTARAVLAVGKTVETEFRKSEARKREVNALEGISVDTSSDTLESLKNEVHQSDLNTKQTSWPTQVRAKIGSLLISMLLQVAKVTVEGKDPVDGSVVEGRAPAFYHSYQYQNGSKVGVVKVHRNLAKQLSGETMANAVQPQRLPMLVKPRPWVAWNKGGYLYSSSKIMRSKDSPEQTAYLKTASDRGDIDKVYEGLNVLGETAWTVNKPIFDIVHKVWNQGEKFLDIPPNVDVKVQFPDPPPRHADPSERRDWKRECRQLYNENQQMFSQRCDINYKLEIARAFLGERFYFPHNMDFRGRAYPLSPHLNHLGNDLSRGLLTFWEGRELGEHGLNWLKIHIANVFGHSKMNFDERCKFVDENIEKVLDSANSPLDGQHKWWMEAENPWQTLAACMELRNAYQLDDPTKYVSRLPVHQDGTCNGLQHYAALGGDIEGAGEVNLIPSDRPQDVYTSVLKIVERMVRDDAENKNHPEAKAVLDRLSRKLVKQTVMTNVYGVTFVGARQQIANKLKDFDDLDRTEVFKLATYLAHKVLEAVRTLFYGAHLIQDWLGDNATLIARSVRLDVNGEDKKSRKTKRKTTPNYMSSVIWTTPLGLPIVQPYREDKKKQVVTAIQSVFIADPYALRGVNARKQRTAFPPNYIHSLDATHMLMAAIGCGKEAISFASVHDSYWTHAGDVDKMNRVIRESFIELHQIDLIEKLRDEFSQRYDGLLHLVHIPKECDLADRITRIQEKYSQEIKGGKKLTIEEQLEIEKSRIQLLQSDDPAEVERGEMMVTPVSIVESLDENELEDLVNTAKDISTTNKKPKKVRRQFKSTEHQGTGADTFQQEELLELQQEDVDEDADVISSSPSSMASMTESAGLSKKDAKLMSILVPLRIPPVPPKGSFDVTQLRNSDYFFS